MVTHIQVKPVQDAHQQQKQRPSRFSPIKRRIKTLQRVWNHCQIGHRSHYSVERMLAFRDYHQRTSFSRALAVCLLTPIPALSVSLALDCIPLRSPTDGWQANYAAWIRLHISTFIISMGLVFQVKEVIVKQTISHAGGIIISMGTATAYVGISIGIAAAWRFPIPYGYVLLVGLYVSLFWIFTILVIGPRVLSKSSVLRQQVKSQILIVATQGILAVAYPAFSAVFMRLSGVEQTAFVLVMPVIKFCTKQIIASAAEGIHEYVGPIVVFSVDVFNVFYVAICMQSATSMATTLVIVASDSFHVVMALHAILVPSVHEAAIIPPARYLQDLPAIVCQVLQEPTAIFTRKQPIRVLAPFPLLLSDESQGIMNKFAKSDRWAHETFARDLYTNRDNLNQAVVGTVATKAPIATISVAQKHDLADPEMVSNPVNSSHLELLQADADENDPILSISRRTSWVAPGKAPAYKNMKAIATALQTLFHSEYVLMAEYIEFMLPMLYALYLAALFHLPVAAYYPHTVSLTSSKLVSTLENIVAFAAIEFASFAGLVVLLRRKFGFSPVYQLAFVLETQARTLQGHLFVWTPFILHLTLAHYGVNFKNTF